MLHWRDGADGKGALLVGDSITVVPDRRFVSFMTSYPNLIPMSESKVRGILSAVEPYEFDRIYGGWWDRNVMSGAKDAVTRSAERYIQHMARGRETRRSQFRSSAWLVVNGPWLGPAARPLDRPTPLAVQPVALGSFHHWLECRVRAPQAG